MKNVLNKTIVYVKFWKSCSNSCRFCNQQLNKNFNIFEELFIEPSKNSIIKNIIKLKEYLIYLIENKNYNDIEIKFMGGELFHRSDIPELFEGFEYLADEIINIISTYYLKCNIACSIYSNFQYEDLSLYKHFIKRLYNHNEEIINNINLAT